MALVPPPHPVPCREARVRAGGRAVGPVRRRPPGARPHRAHAHRGAPLQGRHRRGPVGLHAGAGRSQRALAVLELEDAAGLPVPCRRGRACLPTGLLFTSAVASTFHSTPCSGSPSASSPTCAPTAARRRAGAWSTRASTWWTRGPWPPAGALPLCFMLVFHAGVSCWSYGLFHAGVYGFFHAGVCGLFRAGASFASTWRMAWTLATRRCVLPLLSCEARLWVFLRTESCWAVERVP